MGRLGEREGGRAGKRGAWFLGLLLAGPFYCGARCGLPGPGIPPFSPPVSGEDPLLLPAGPGIPRIPPAPAAPGADPPRSFPLSWERWWKFNKDPFEQLRKKVRSLPKMGGRPILPGRVFHPMPPGKILDTFVVPALERFLRRCRKPDSICSSLMALAEIGRGKNLGKIFSRYRKDPNPVVSATAILCFGVAGLEDALSSLEEIFLDTPRGRRLVGRKTGVGYWRRAFAGYALGLLAYASRRPFCKERVFRAARRVLENPESPKADVPVAAVLAIRLLNPDLSRSWGRALAADASRQLLAYALDGSRPIPARAHALDALARLLGRGSSGRADLPPHPEFCVVNDRARVIFFRRKTVHMMETFLEKHEENPLILQSCVLALGEMGDPADQSLVELLEKTSEGRLSRDLQTRFFADIALGFLGGAGSRKAIESLALRLKEGVRRRERPWVGLGLGVSQAELLMHQKPATAGVGDVLVDSFQETRTPKWRGALAIALGLARYSDAGPLVRWAMNQSNVTAFKGYCALSLGLMNDKDARDDLVEMLGESLCRPSLAVPAAVGLGLMGDKSVVERLCRLLMERPPVLGVQSALLTGLGRVGDLRVVPFLVGMLFDADLAERARVLAAEALGKVGEKGDLPWNSKIAFGLNYRTEVETLAGGFGGILDF